MKLLVLAQIPPPVHGQSTMVRTLVEDLPAEWIQLHHVNLSLSEDASDIGRWRVRKATRVLQAAIRAISGRLRHRCDTLYYVPAPPGKRGALFRDWLLMALCRPWFPRLVLHWHAPGLGAWLSTRATTVERVITRFLLSGANPAIVLSSALRTDAEIFGPKRVEIVPNGVDDPGPPRGRPPVETEFRVLFLGLCHEQKGVFAAAGAVLAANRSRRREAGPLFVLEVAGPSPDEATLARLRALAREHPEEIRLHGEVGPTARRVILDHCVIGENYDLLDSPRLRWEKVSAKDAGKFPLYLELNTKTDNPRIPDRPGRLKKTPDASPRSYFGVTRVLYHDEDVTPQETLEHLEALVAAPTPAQFAAMARQAVRAWGAGTATAQDVKWLNWLIDNGALVNSRNLTPALRTLTDRYRAMEAGMADPTVVAGMGDFDPGADHPIFQAG